MLPVNGRPAPGVYNKDTNSDVRAYKTNICVIVRVHLFSVLSIKRPKGVSAARALGLLIVKRLNKCTKSSLVSDLHFRQIRYIPVYGNIAVYGYVLYY